MHHVRPIFTCLLTSILTLALRGNVPETLTLADLQNHPERLPWTISTPKELKTDKGSKIAKGTQARLVEIRDDTMVLEIGTATTRVVPIAGSELLAEANKLWQKLTPAQRAIDASTLATDPSLWPEKIKILEKLNVSNEWGRLEPGMEFPLISCEADGIQLGRDNLPRHPVIVDARSTDIIARARELALLPSDQRPSRLEKVLQGKLVDAQGKPASLAASSQHQIFAFYFGAGWCNPCRQFSPQLVKTLSPLLASKPQLVCVYLSNDKTTAAMQTYMQTVQMPWLGVTFESWSKTPLLMSYSCSTVPQLLVLDRHGRVLANSIQGERYIGPRPALQELVRLLGTGVAH